jgi:hypothetical protein
MDWGLAQSATMRIISRSLPVRTILGGAPAAEGCDPQFLPSNVFTLVPRTKTVRLKTLTPPKTVCFGLRSRLLSNIPCSALPPSRHSRHEGESGQAWDVNGVPVRFHRAQDKGQKKTPERLNEVHRVRGRRGLRIVVARATADRSSPSTLQLRAPEIVGTSCAGERNGGCLHDA